MFIRAPRFSPSQKLVALAFGERRFSDRPPRRPGDRHYVTVSMPSLTTARKRRQTVIYAGHASIWVPKERFPFGEFDYTVEDFITVLDSRGSTQCSLDDHGDFLSIDPAPVDDVIAMAQILKQAFSSLGDLPEGYDGWFVEA